MLKALIFDVDGTLADTEELHRASFNKVFFDFGLNWYWTKEAYGKLLTTTGGKERMARFAREQTSEHLDLALIAEMHAAKNAYYAEAVDRGALALRPGVRRLVQDAGERGLKLGIATTTSQSNLEALLQSCFSQAEQDYFSAIICGENVSIKKPNPEVYLQCLTKLGLDAAEAIAIEDSAVGLAAARAARIATIVTPSLYTRADNFAGALVVLDQVPDSLDALHALLPDLFRT